VERRRKQGDKREQQRRQRKKARFCVVLIWVGLKGGENVEEVVARSSW
jgi:hypothetical protein